LRNTRNHESVNIGISTHRETYEFISAFYATRYNRYRAPVAIHNSVLIYIHIYPHNETYCSLHFITIDYTDASKRGELHNNITIMCIQMIYECLYDCMYLCMYACACNSCQLQL